MPIRKAGWKSSRRIGVSARPIDSPQSELTLPVILTDDRLGAGRRLARRREEEMGQC